MIRHLYSLEYTCSELYALSEGLLFNMVEFRLFLSPGSIIASGDVLYITVWKFAPYTCKQGSVANSSNHAFTVTITKLSFSA